MVIFVIPCLYARLCFADKLQVVPSNTIVTQCSHDSFYNLFLDVIGQRADGIFQANVMPMVSKRLLFHLRFTVGAAKMKSTSWTHIHRTHIFLFRKFTVLKHIRLFLCAQS